MRLNIKKVYPRKAKMVCETPAGYLVALLIPTHRSSPYSLKYLLRFTIISLGSHTLKNQRSPRDRDNGLNGYRAARLIYVDTGWQGDPPVFVDLHDCCKRVLHVCKSLGYSIALGNQLRQQRRRNGVPPFRLEDPEPMVSLLSFAGVRGAVFLKLAATRDRLCHPRDHSL